MFSPRHSHLVVTTLQLHAIDNHLVDGAVCSAQALYHDVYFNLEKVLR